MDCKTRKPLGNKTRKPLGKLLSYSTQIKYHQKHTWEEDGVLRYPNCTLLGPWRSASEKNTGSYSSGDASAARPEAQKTGSRPTVNPTHPSWVQAAILGTRCPAYYYLFVGVSGVFVLHGIKSSQPVPSAHLECYQVLHDGVQGLLFVCQGREF